MSRIYETGADFVKDLHDVYGLLGAHDIATDYLTMQECVTDPEEREFCNQIETGLNELEEV